MDLFLLLRLSCLGRGRRSTRRVRGHLWFLFGMVIVKYIFSSITVIIIDKTFALFFCIFQSRRIQEINPSGHHCKNYKNPPQAKHRQNTVLFKHCIFGKYIIVLMKLSSELLQSRPKIS